MRYYRSTLGQEYVSVEQADLYASIGGQVETFKRNYAAWASEGQASLAQIARDLEAIRQILLKAQQARYQRGDIEGMRALGAEIAKVEALQRTHAEVTGTASRWQRSWEVLASWLSQVGSWMGLGVPILIPLAVGTAVAAIGALAWVINTWQGLRAQTATIKNLADQVARGELTAEQARTIAESAKPAPLFDLGGLGTMLPLALGGVLLIFLFVRR